MQNRLRIWPLALLAVVAVSSADSSAWAQLTGRSAANGRQRVRAALAKAIADGTLSRAEEDSIYRRAKGLLTPEELPGLRRTLGRLAGRQTAPLPSTRPEPAAKQPAHRQGPEETIRTGPSVPDGEEPDGEEAEGLAESASYEEPAAEDDPPGDEDDQPADEDDLENPFEEEGLLESAELTDDATMVCEDGCCEEPYQYNILSNFQWPSMFQSLKADGLRNVSFYSTVDAFKGPLDLDNRNGNFGVSLAVNGGIPLAKRYGVGLQAGTSAVLSNFYGTEFTGSTIRSQNFTTVGLFQQLPFLSGNLKWGFAYDWLYDDYYTTFTMGQWRVKLGYELDRCREIGIWAAVADKGDGARLGSSQTGFTTERFEPVAQGSLYYRRCWQSGIGTTAWLGIAEEPGELVFGTDARIPITYRLALIGNFSYILPSASGEAGQDEEMWNVSIGIELTPRAWANRCPGTSKYAPLLPLANNGSFAVRRL